MRRKKLISPEKSVQDSIEYRFKILLFPSLFCILASAIAGSFCFSIFAFINIQSITEATLTTLSFALGLLVAETLGLWFILKESDFVMTSEYISVVDYWYRRKCIGWQEITFIKHCQLFGIRCVSIKTADGKSVRLSPSFYKTSEILDRVRELAGEEHILVRALEKELSRPRREFTKVWCWVIGSIVLTMSIYLIGGNMYAAEQEKPSEQAIAAYVRQHPTTAPNQSAIELQALMTKLGLSVEAFGDGSEVKVTPTLAASNEWKSIEISLNDFINKRLDKTEDSLRLIPGLPYLISPRIRLAAVDRHREVFKGITYWRKQNICRTDGNSGVTSRIEFSEHTIDPLMLTNQYPKVLKQDLLWELTTSVRQVKAKLAAGQNVDGLARDFQLQSQVCPGERWTAKAIDGAVNIEFSHPPDWKALGISNPTKRDSLTYTIKPIAKT